MHQFDVTSLFMFRSFPFISYTIMDFPDFANHFRFAAFGFHGEVLVFNVIPKMRCHLKVEFVFSISVYLSFSFSLHFTYSNPLDLSIYFWFGNDCYDDRISMSSQHLFFFWLYEPFVNKEISFFPFAFHTAELYSLCMHYASIVASHCCASFFELLSRSEIANRSYYKHTDKKTNILNCRRNLSKHSNRLQRFRFIRMIFRSVSRIKCWILKTDKNSIE